MTSDFTANAAKVLEGFARVECARKVRHSKVWKKGGKPEFTVNVRGEGTLGPEAEAFGTSLRIRGTALVHFKDSSLEDMQVRYTAGESFELISNRALMWGLNSLFESE